MTMPKVSLSPDEATGLVTVKAEWTYDPATPGIEYLNRETQAGYVCEPLIKELAVLLAMLDGYDPTDTVRQ